MAEIIQLQEESLPPDCFVYKHSTQCSLSAVAAEEVRAASWTRPLYWINVIEQRPLSNWIEAHYGVRHESPQLLFIENGKVTKQLTHRAIKKSAFADWCQR